MTNIGVYLALVIAIGVVFYVIYRGLHEREMIHKELVKSEKLSSLGRLVAGIAHELNTPIGSSITTASTLVNRSKKAKQALESGQIKKSQIQAVVYDAEQGSEAILTSLQRASDLIANFKKIAVDQAVEQQREFNLDDYIADMSHTFDHIFKHSNVRLKLNLHSDLIMNSYPGALSQIVINLVQNAVVHGFEEGETGEVIITTGQASYSTCFVLVQDNGKGIDTKKITKVFDPFFTTRLGNGGSGLGLNICYNLVGSILGGQLKVKSDQMKKVTEFSLILPIQAPEQRGEYDEAS